MLTVDVAIRRAATGEPAQQVESELIPLLCITGGCQELVQCPDCLMCSLHCRCGLREQEAARLGLGEFWQEERRHVEAFRRRLGR